VALRVVVCGVDVLAASVVAVAAVVIEGVVR